MVTMIEIVKDVALTGNAEAHIDADGALTIIQDETLPANTQVYVHLNARQVEGLRHLLARSSELVANN